MHDLEKHMREVQNEAFVDQMSNCTLTLLRPTAEYDEYEGGNPPEKTIKTNVTALIIEESRLVDDPASTTPRTVRYLTCRFHTSIDVQVNDRLKDEQTGQLYSIQGFRQHKNPLAMQGRLMDIVRVGSKNS